jgi:four helix bundle protein
MNKKDLKTHKDLELWKKAMELAEKIYSLTAKFPKEEIYGLTAQLRRSAVSVPSNIAEGAARNSHKEFIQFLYISMGSISELETQIILAKRLKLLKNNYILNDVDTIRKMTVGLIYYLKGRKTKKA